MGSCCSKEEKKILIEEKLYKGVYLQVMEGVPDDQIRCYCLVNIDDDPYRSRLMQECWKREAEMREEDEQEIDQLEEEFSKSSTLFTFEEEDLII